MVQVMIFPIEIVGCPIVREKSGLALSSRNALLSEQERTTAAVIYRTLWKANNWCTKKQSLKQAWVIDRLNAIDGLKVEYYEIVNGIRYNPSPTGRMPTTWWDALLFIAVKFVWLII